MSKRTLVPAPAASLPRLLPLMLCLWAWTGFAWLALPAWPAAAGNFGPAALWAGLLPASACLALCLLPAPAVAPAMAIVRRRGSRIAGSAQRGRNRRGATGAGRPFRHAGARA
jgi:hypothetical protein